MSQENAAVSGQQRKRKCNEEEKTERSESALDRERSSEAPQTGANRTEADERRDGRMKNSTRTMWR